MTRLTPNNSTPENPTPCYCGQAVHYRDCCGRFLDGGAYPRDPRTLMRSRYSAYAMQNLTYLLKTWHPRTCPVLTTESLSGTQWHGLEVIRSLAGFKKGWVEFRAHYTDVDGVPHHLHEISEFHKVKNRWVYHSELDDWPDDESESGHR